MVRIVNAGAQAGYSGTDHLIDESEIKEVIGVEYHNSRQALSAVASRCWMAAHAGKPARHHPYVWAELQYADGVTRTIKG